MKIDWAIVEPSHADDLKLFEVCRNYIPNERAYVLEENDPLPATNGYLIVLDYNTLVKQRGYNPYWNAHAKPLRMVVEETIRATSDIVSWHGPGVRVYDTRIQANAIQQMDVSDCIIQVTCDDYREFTSNIDERKQIKFLDPEVEKIHKLYNLESFKSQLFFLNTEPGISEAIDLKFDNIHVCCSGFMEQNLVQKLKYLPSRVIHYDINQQAVQLRSKFPQTWSGVNQLFSDLGNDPNWRWPSGFTYTEENLSKWFDQYLKDINVTQREWTDAWKKCSTLKHEYYTLDLLRHNLPTYNESNLIWISHIFATEYLFWKYTKNEIENLYLGFLNSLVGRNCWIYGYSPNLRKIKFERVEDLIDKRTNNTNFK